MKEPSSNNDSPKWLQYLPSVGLVIALMLTGGWKVGVDKDIEFHYEAIEAERFKGENRENCIIDLQATVRVQQDRIETLEGRVDILAESSNIQTQILLFLFEQETGERWETISE